MVLGHTCRAKEKLFVKITLEMYEILNIAFPYISGKVSSLPDDGQC